jgi:hypothetical protein
MRANLCRENRRVHDAHVARVVHFQVCIHHT